MAMSRVIRAVLVLFMLSWGGMLRADDHLFAGTPVSILVEEQLLAAGEQDIPVDGRIELRLPAALPETGARLEGFSFDPRSGMFATRLVTPQGDSIGFRGQALIAVPVYVPVRRIAAGTVLTENDFQTVDIALNTLPAKSLRAPQDIVGMESRRILLQGRPVVEGSISEPLVIERGDKVTIVLSSGGLNLSAPGKSLEDGARGDDVRIVNLTSNVALTATVVKEGLVEVVP